MPSQSQMENLGYNDLTYGWDLDMLYMIMHPNEYWMALSYLEVHACIIKMVDMELSAEYQRLFTRHGRIINFLR